jgi:phosphatidyl-myo-inositol alpha-mannosyltransferase
VLEAMAIGVPVVAADLVPFVDLLGPAVPGGPAAGRLFPAGDPQALAGAVIEVLRQPDPAGTALARQRARRYDWSSVGAAVLAVYRAAVPGGDTVEYRQQVASAGW